MLKPILFNTEMVKALMEGRKTMTRRLVKNKDIINAWDCEADGTPVAWIDQGTGDSYAPTMPCRYQPGDILYVRETWTELCYVDPDGYTHYDQTLYYYAADGTPDITLVDADGFELDDQRIRWKPSIHMPKEAARIFLRVKSVRVERLKEISASDAMAEGFTDWNEFVTLWDSTIPKHPNKFKSYPYYWKDNPWVWVIEFERISKEDAGCV